MTQATSDVTRRSFVTWIPAAAAAGPIALGAATAEAAPGDDGESSGVHDAFPRQDPALVRDVVSKSHFDYDAVKGLVEGSPALAKAAWDWGFGDWESALGAAAHTGRRQIAEVLIANGARPNLFSAAMLGQLDVVAACVEASGGTAQRNPGPHGITLLQHAKAGGDAAESVVAYLQQLGDADGRASSQPLSDEDRERFVGTYVYGPAQSERFDIVVRKDGMLAFQREGSPSRPLFCLSAGVFHPSGAEAVRIVFGGRGDVAETVTVHDPEPVVVGRRS